jgi:hypothetical protein
MTAQGLFVIPSWLNNRNVGTASAVPGTATAAMMTPNAAFLPGKSNFARAYPPRVARSVAPPAPMTTYRRVFANEDRGDVVEERELAGEPQSEAVEERGLRLRGVHDQPEQRQDAVDEEQAHHQREQRRLSPVQRGPAAASERRPVWSASRRALDIGDRIRGGREGHQIAFRLPTRCTR